jgi:hypothetical protein
MQREGPLRAGVTASSLFNDLCAVLSGLADFVGVTIRAAVFYRVSNQKIAVQHDAGEQVVELCATPLASRPTDSSRCASRSSVSSCSCGLVSLTLNT